MVALAVLVFVGGGVAYLKREGPFMCLAQGVVDTPTHIVSPKGAINIQGWAWDPVSINRVEVTSDDGRALVSAPLNEFRFDVAQRLHACKPRGAMGFSLNLPPDLLQPQTKKIAVHAVNGKGQRRTLGTLPVDFSLPFGQLDSLEPIELDGRNVIRGWAIAREGEVTIQVLALGKKVMELKAAIPRADVARAYAQWPRAKTAGFENVLGFRSLPRGRYFLQVIYVDAKGNKRELRGPEVINDSPFGKVIAQQERLFNAQRINLVAWLADENGITQAQLQTEQGIVLGDMLLTKAGASLTELPDPRFGNAPSPDVPIKTGSLYHAELFGGAIPVGLHRLQVRVVDSVGNQSFLPGPLILNQIKPTHTACTGEKRYIFYPGGAVDFRDGFRQMTELRTLAQGGCIEVGVRGRLEYLRTTRGAQADFEFDPAFPENLRARHGGMTGESLNELLQTALKFKAPLLITLDGGVWADAKFSAPDVDVVDYLEQDPRTAQWNQWGRPEPDDALQNLPGATHSPQLARMMSLNRYNTKFLSYKKRNLQAAVRDIVRFAEAHPQTYIAVSLDPDLYINPWFYLSQWYDYHPDTLRQYREWLFHLGPYADGGELAFSRHEPKLTLAQATQWGKAKWSSVEQVEPPRGVIDYSDPWQQLWTQFKRHLVARHYDDLAAWIVEAGLAPDRIYSGQTFIQTDVAVGITDTATGWTDQAGVSIAGAKPRLGHIGAILYGPASRNQGPTRNGWSLVDNIRLLDPHWAVGEFHPATIAFPDKLPTHEESYATLSTLLNGGAYFLSPMWGSFVGDRVVRPRNFKAYDAMEGTAYEFQLVWWLRATQSLSPGSFFYPFGNEMVTSADGWTAHALTALEKQKGSLRLSATHDEIAIVSPFWAALSLDKPSTLEVSVAAMTQVSPPRAEMELDDGHRRRCSLRLKNRTIWTCDFAAANARRMHSLKLTWPVRGRNNEVLLDSVALRFAP